MRDAFGGVFMVRLFLVFIVIYVAFSAISLNYAKAFRVKNKVISAIEESQITKLENFKNSGLDEKINNILKNANYRKTCEELGYDDGVIKDKSEITQGYCYKGIVIMQGDLVNNTQTYEVIAFNDWNLGILNMILALGGESAKDPTTGRWAIRGEAKVVVRK